MYVCNVETEPCRSSVNMDMSLPAVTQEDGYNKVFHGSQPVSDKITSSGNVTTDNINGGAKAT